MITKQEIITTIQNSSDDRKVAISQITIKEQTIIFSIYAEDSYQAQDFKSNIERIILEKYPEYKPIISTGTHNIKIKRNIEGIKKIITISSGKGGVGKSTISATLAKLLAEQNYKVGLIDADIHGPSLPRILNVQDAQPEFCKGKIMPIIACGIKIMSIGFLMENKEALAWRGPMLSKAVMRLFLDVNWGDLDYLIVDTPPGTGDVHITILSNCKIDGVFIVTIPSLISLDSALRSIDLYEKFGINIYGIIENMSYYYDQSSKQKIPLFGESLTSKIASKHELNMITPIDLIPGLSEVKFADITKYMKIDLQTVDL